MRISSALNQYQSFNANRTIAEKINHSGSGVRSSMKKNQVALKNAGMLKKVPSDLQMILSKDEKQMLNKLFPQNATNISMSVPRHYSQYGSQIDLRI